MVGINQSMEVISALKTFISQGRLIMADGKFGIDDIRKLGPAYEALKLAREGSSEIVSELKDLDPGEIETLLIGVAELAMLAYEALDSSPK